jgi:hypothetical protein
VLGDIVSTRFDGRLTKIRYEVVGEDGERTALEHVCSDDPIVDAP